jgi:hypothetical protein
VGANGQGRTHVDAAHTGLNLLQEACLKIKLRLPRTNLRVLSDRITDALPHLRNMELVRGLPHARVEMLALPMRSQLGSAHGLAICSILVLASTGCADGVSNDSKCRNLVYKEGGLSRAEYLPCAGEIVAALEVVDQNTEKALDGDGQARSEGQAALGRARGLMRAAGGRNLLERWQDQALTDMNVSISNAVTHYEAFYMLRVLDEPHPYAAKTREAAEAEYRGATRRYEEARRAYRRLQ